MNTSGITLFVTAVVGLISLGTVAADPASEILERAKNIKGIGAYRLEVEVDRKSVLPADGTEQYSFKRDVRVSGVVRSQEVRDEIERISREESPQSTVHVDIEVNSAFGGPEEAQDPTLAERVLQRIKNYHPYGTYKVQVTAARAVVVLEGLVESDFVKTQIGEVAAGVQGVARVDNRLTVSVPDREFPKVAQ